MNYRQSPGFALVLLVLAGCAVQGGPGGGPVDNTGPELISCFPEDGATGVDSQTAIVMYFSEPLDARAIDNVLQVTPRLKTVPRVKVQRHKLTVKLDEPLQSDRTYIFNFGRNLKDYQSNLTAREIKLAFATGDSIDQGLISGRVSEMSANSKTEVWLFRDGGAFPDTIWLAEPDYIVSVDQDGYYQATNLSIGAYRALAVCDERPRPKFLSENDLLAPPQTEPLKINNRRDRLENVNFRLSKIYLKPFQLLNAKPLDGYLELDFSRPLMDTCLTSGNFIFSDGNLTVSLAWINEEQPTRIIMLTDSLRPQTEYQISVTGIRSENGDTLISEDHSARFNWPARADTLQPKIANSSPSANAKNVELSVVMQINLTEPITGDSLRNDVELLCGDTLKVPVKTRWLDANSLVIEPPERLLSATNYTVHIDTRNWRDYAENYFQDSLIALKLNTIDQDLFGSISGKILFSGGLAPHNLIIEASLVGAQNFSRQARCDSVGLYKIDNLLPGKYTFSIWEDRNNNGKYDYGRLVPYIPAEPYHSYPEQISVRSRWETAEINWSY